MKHLLNNLTESQKKTIREQYKGGMKIDTSRFKKLLESTLGDVKPLIFETDTNTTTETTRPVTGSMNPSKNPNTTTVTTKPAEYVDTSNWIKVAVFSDPQATDSVLTNIQIDPSMIGLQGTTVMFDYRIAGKSQTGTGKFDCNSTNSMHFDGKPLSGSPLYISNERVGVLSSKCGKNQGYASTGSNTNQNMA